MTVFKKKIADIRLTEYPFQHYQAVFVILVATANAVPQYGSFPQLAPAHNPYANSANTHSFGGKPHPDEVQRQWAQYAEYFFHILSLTEQEQE
jgi:hypothetical protein